MLLRYAIRVNGLTELALTKMDVLSGPSSVKLCTAYTAEAKTHTELPLGPADLAPFQAVYEEMPGWAEDVTGAHPRRPARRRPELHPAHRSVERPP